MRSNGVAAQLDPLTATMSGQRTYKAMENG